MATTLAETRTSTAVGLESADLEQQVQDLLSRVRGHLRTRIWAETIARGGTLILAWFLAVWALDYLPIWIGANELPVTVRATLLLGMCLGLSAVVYWWGIRRSNVPLRDEDLALLLERQHPELSDRLATYLQLRRQPSRNANQAPWESAMRTAAVEGLQTCLESLEPQRLYDWRQVYWWRRWWVVTAVLALGLLIFAPQWFAMALRREILLDARRWPRQSDIEMGKLYPTVDARLTQLLGETPVILPEEGVYRIGRGSDIQLRVEARTETSSDVETRIATDEQFVLAERQHTVPSRCTILYQYPDGQSGKQYMTRIGALENQNEGFRFEGPPFQEIARPFQFDVYGNDDRLGPLRIVPVDNLALVQLVLDCRYPPYLENSGGSRWLPQALSWTEGLTLPRGTQLVAEFHFSKSVQRILLLPAGGSQVRFDWQGEPQEKLRLELPRLDQDQDWELWAQDHHQVWTRQSMRFSIQARPDRPPVVEADLVGIENAVTPDARLPVRCVASDDYGLKQLQMMVQLPVTRRLDAPGDSTSSDDSDSTQETDLGQQVVQALSPTENPDEFEATIDLRLWQQKYQDVASLEVDQQQIIELSVLATDYFRAGEVGAVISEDESASNNDGHPSRSPRIQLELVSPATLLRLLKRSEVGQRRRLEQIYGELLDQQFYLQRCQALLEPGETESTTGSGDEGTIPPWEMAGVFARRAATQNEKSRRELMGVQEAFLRIVQQIVNNRLEAAEYRRRLEGRIIDQMQLLVTDDLGQADSTLKELNAQWQGQSTEVESESNDRDSQKATALLKVASDRNQAALERLDQILQDLLKFESDAELYELVRQLYDQQKRLLEQTSRQQQERAFEDLFGN